MALQANQATTSTNTAVDNSLAFTEIQATTCTKTEFDTGLLLKQIVINSVPGTGERLLEANVLKRIFAVAPLNVKTCLDINNPNDPKNANIELNIDQAVLDLKSTN